MRDFFILALVVVFFTLALNSRTAGMLTYWWFSIFRPHDWIWSSLLTDLRVPLIAALLLVVPTTVQKITPRLNNPISILILMMLGILLLANITAGCSSVPITKTASILDLVILFYIVLLTSRLITSKIKLFWLVTVVAISLAAHSGKAGLIALATGEHSGGINNLTGLFSGSNAFALGSGMLLFFLIFAFQFINSPLIYDTQNPQWYRSPVINKVFKIALLLCCIGTFYNIVSLESRGSFLAACFSLLLWVLLHKNRVKLFIFASVTFALIIAFFPIPDNFEQRVASVFVEEEERDKSAASRPHFWEVASNMAKSHPLGVGPGCYPAYYNEFDTSGGNYGRFRSVHSSHFQILADAGYLGVLVWISLFIITYWKLFKIRRITKQLDASEPDSSAFYFYISSALICSTTVFILGGAFYEYAYNDIIWLIFALVIAIERNLHSDIGRTSK